MLRQILLCLVFVTTSAGTVFAQNCSCSESGPVRHCEALKPHAVESLKRLSRLTFEISKHEQNLESARQLQALALVWKLVADDIEQSDFSDCCSSCIGEVLTSIRFRAERIHAELGVPDAFAGEDELVQLCKQIETKRETAEPSCYQHVYDAFGRLQQLLEKVQKSSASKNASILNQSSALANLYQCFLHLRACADCPQKVSARINDRSLKLRDAADYAVVCTFLVYYPEFQKLTGKLNSENSLSAAISWKSARRIAGLADNEDISQLALAWSELSGIKFNSESDIAFRWESFHVLAANFPSLWLGGRELTEQEIIDNSAKAALQWNRNLLKSSIYRWRDKLVTQDLMTCCYRN